jgi:large subunit ribosomal protein L21
MYAIFEDGSRQYKVGEGDVVRVDHREVELGARLEFPRVLLVADGADVSLGRPMVTGARVVGDVVDHPSIKVMIQHFRRRKNYRRLKGHRQHYVAVKVKHILLAGQEAPPVPTSEKPAVAAE